MEEVATNKYLIRYACSSHIGNRREMNQDNFICDGKYLGGDVTELKFPLNGSLLNEQPLIFGVFDGMGGGECGEVASLIAAKNAAALEIGEDPLNDLLSFVTTANNEICNYVTENELKVMGTTAAILVFTEDEVISCNIGDSKIFRFADEKLEQISEDHVAVDTGKKKPPLTQCIGIPESVKTITPHIERDEYVENVTYLACSDGLTDMVSVDVISDCIKRTKFSKIADILLNHALKNGGRDNITILLCRVEKEKKGGFWNLFHKEKQGVA